MARWLPLVIALTCFGGLASPAPMPASVSLQELIKELLNVTQDQKAPVCNGSMVWNTNLTSNVYCAALDALINVSNCSAIHRTQRILSGLCTHKAATGVSSLQDRHTKIEVTQFVKDLLRRLQQLYRHNG